jgi:hypothetical protein
MLIGLGFSLITMEVESQRPGCFYFYLYCFSGEDHESALNCFMGGGISRINANSTRSNK